MVPWNVNLSGKTRNNPERLLFEAVRFRLREQTLILIIMATQTKPKNFSGLYTAIKYHPDYQEWQDAGGRKHNNADKLIQGWIWQSTNEEKWRKRDLTLEEYNRIVKELYAIGGKLPRKRIAKIVKSDDPKDNARKKLMAAWHRRLELLHYNECEAYKADPVGYVIACIMRTCGKKYKDINDVPLWVLNAKYQKVCADNREMEKAI